MQKIQSIRGMNDILPEHSALWQYLEATSAALLERYGYREIRIPIVEYTGLFKRSIGEVTDIVEKEMYTFLDRNDDSLTLRPEGTAGVVRAAEQHGLLYNQTPKFYYMGPMFRYERPQKGRSRQFHQLGVEAFGLPGPDIDAELLLMTARLWQELGFFEHVHLEINSIGASAHRQAYRQALIDYLSPYKNELDADSQRRLDSNPLRILDSKHPKTQELIANAPLLSDYLDSAAIAHFEALQTLLDHAGLRYTVNPKLVRGLDYYCHTVFEWVTHSLGAQGTICAGGRYDGLVEQLGGKPTPGIGFAMGLERLVLLLENVADIGDKIPPSIDIYIAFEGEKAQSEVLNHAEQLRNHLPSLRILSHCGSSKLKRQLKKASQVQARHVLIFSDHKNEITLDTIKDSQPPQRLTDINAVIDQLKRIYN